MTHFRPLPHPRSNPPPHHRLHHHHHYTLCHRPSFSLSSSSFNLSVLFKSIIPISFLFPWRQLSTSAHCISLILSILFNFIMSFFVSSNRCSPFRFIYLFSFLLFFYLFLFIPSCYAEKQLEYNCGGFAIDGYNEDPVALISGEGARYTYRGTPPQTLTVGQTHRWGSSKGFVYDFPVGDGQYDVDLIFAEIYPPAQANFRRRFDVFIEDDIAFKDIDVYKSVGPDTELKLTKTKATVSDGALSIAFRKGSIENPMVSGIVIRASNGSDISIEPFKRTDGVGSKPAPGGVWDHQAHAVAGGPYKGTDYNGNGLTDLFIDGRRSHSHYNDPDTGESGRVVKYQWFIGDNVISTAETFNYEFPVGMTTLKLAVEDQTGDKASAETEVTVLPITAAGAYCYYYNGTTDSLPKNLMDENGPRPDDGHSTNVINFFGDTFVYSQKRRDDGSPNIWATRCVTDFQSVNTTQYKFSVQYRGAGATLYVNEGMKAKSGDTNGEVKTISANVMVSDTTVSLQLIFYSGGVDEPQLSLLVDDIIAPAHTLSYKTALVLPTISSISSTQVQPQGGSQLQIVGTGFFNNVSVSIGGVQNVRRTLISPTLLQLPSVPSMVHATGVNEADAIGRDIEAELTVYNNAGPSNKVRLSYTTNARKGISWEQTVLKQNTDSDALYVVKQVTSIKIGPDSKYYLGSYGGFVSRMEIGKDLKVKSKCDSKKLGDRRAILGLAFNYASPEIRVYVSSNTLYIHAEREAAGWPNGAIETFVDKSIKSCNECLCYERRVITGLPVSGHDHGVNGILFLPSGDLLLSVGGATNMGVASHRLGGVAESPLSGAILLAKLSKGSSFDGHIKYDNYTHPGSAKQTSGFDVSVYASGLRNCFALIQHTNGQIWATDNGPNRKFGSVSTSCTTKEDEMVHPDVNGKDEVNMIIKGNYYGHPNRNRGECIYGEGIGPMLRIQSATTGITEYTSNAFSGTLQGQLILSKYAASGDGRTWRVSISQDGKQLSQPLPMSGTSGVTVENGLHGELIMPKVQKGFISVLKPVYAYNSASGIPFVIAISPNRGRAGHRVFIGGEGFSKTDPVVVRFGGTDATNVYVMDSHGLFCVAPTGAGTVEITVFVNGISSKDTSGQGGTVKFLYTP